MRATTLVFLGILCMLLGSIIFATSRPKDATADSTAPPSGYTGAPGDAGTCVTCHTGASGTGFVYLATTRPWGYVPGVAETLDVGIAEPSATQNRWGFEVTILKDSDKSMAGTLTPIPVLGVRVGTAVSGGTTYLAHRSNGATAPLDPNDGTFWGQTGGIAWPFLWTGPPHGSGDVTIYVSTVAANGDQLATGADNTYTTTQSMPEMAPTPVSTTTWGKIKKQYH